MFTMLQPVFVMGWPARAFQTKWHKKKMLFGLGGIPIVSGVDGLRIPGGGVFLAIGD